MKISFVIPVYNEKDSLEELYNEIIAGVGSKTYEIIFIDDGSTDGSVNIIEQLAKMDSNVIVIQFYRNYGKSAALSLKDLNMLKVIVLLPWMLICKMTQLK